MKKSSINFTKIFKFLPVSAFIAFLLLGSCNNGSKIEPVDESTTPTDSTATSASPDERLKGTGAPGKSDDFKFGRFKYDDENQFGDFIIIRSKETQIDSGALTQLVVKFDLKWTSDTSYVLNFREMLANPQNIQLPADPKKLVRKCWMSDIREDSYLETSTSSLGPDTIRSRISILKK